MIPEDNKYARAFFEEYQARQKYKREPQLGRVNPAHYRVLLAVFYAAAIGVVIWALSNIHF